MYYLCAKFGRNRSGRFFNVQISEYRTAANLTYVKANGLAKMMGKYSFFWLLWTDWTASRRPHPADDYCSHEGSSGRNQLHHQEHGSDREAV